MSFMIPLNQVLMLRARTVRLIGVGGGRLCSVLAMYDDALPRMLTVPVDAVFDEPSNETPSAPARVDADDAWDEERWDGLS